MGIKPQVVNAIPNVESFLRHCQRTVHKSKTVTEQDGNSVAICVTAAASYSKHEGPLLDTALPEFERTLIETAMSQTGGRRQEAAGRGRLPGRLRADHLVHQ